MDKPSVSQGVGAALCSWLRSSRPSGPRAAFPFSYGSTLCSPWWLVLYSGHPLDHASHMAIVPVLLCILPRGIRRGRSVALRARCVRRRCSPWVARAAREMDRSSGHTCQQSDTCWSCTLLVLCQRSQADQLHSYFEKLPLPSKILVCSRKQADKTSLLS